MWDRYVMEDSAFANIDKRDEQIKERKDRQMGLDFDQKIREALREACQEVSASEQLKQRIHETVRLKEDISMKNINIRKIAIGVAAACLLVSGVAFAGNTAYFSCSVPNEPEYEAYEQMEEAEGRFGFDVEHIESFRNGYVFAGASIGTAYAHDENGQKLYSNKTMDIDYQKAGEPGIYLTVEKPMESLTREFEADASRSYGDVTISYWEEQVRIEENDFVVTEKELGKAEEEGIVVSTRENGGKAQIANHVEWEKDGLRYQLFGFDLDLTPEELMDMAVEIMNGNE